MAYVVGDSRRTLEHAVLPGTTDRIWADLLGMPSEDRWLMFDWANRVIGWQDPDYAVSASFDSTSGSPFAREAPVFQSLLIIRIHYYRFRGHAQDDKSVHASL